MSKKKKTQFTIKKIRNTWMHAKFCITWIVPLLFWRHNPFPYCFFNLPTGGFHFCSFCISLVQIVLTFIFVGVVLIIGIVLLALHHPTTTSKGPKAGCQSKKYKLECKRWQTVQWPSFLINRVRLIGSHGIGRCIVNTEAHVLDFYGYHDRALLPTIATIVETTGRNRRESPRDVCLPTS